ncbi:MAG: adenosine deaminase [Actinobacteria bacterium]|nr:adenosine deaminase [Actinomycetota bacterium]
MSAAPSPGAGELELATLPKIELHVHLEGSIAATTAVELARRHGEDPEEALEVVRGDDGGFGYPSPFRDFMHFVETFLATTRQVRTPDDLATVAADFARGQAAQGVRWTEATFTALTLVDNGMEPGPMWAALRDGFAEVPDTRIGLIIDSIRELGVDASRRTLQLVEDADAPIVGLGLTGIEGSVPEGEFGHLRDGAARLGIGLAVHAGETGTPDNVRAAVDDLGARRIGHGIAAAQDAELMRRLADEGVVLEVCPSSNVTLSIVPDLASHPLPTLWAAGVPVTINSDDPPFFATTLTEELGHAARMLDLDRSALADLQRRAARASFAPDDVKTDLLAAIDAWETQER